MDTFQSIMSVIECVGIAIELVKLTIVVASSIKESHSDRKEK